MTLAHHDGECTADYARALTDRIKVAVEATWHLIAEAYESRAWAALGYSSWDDYTTREFGTSRLRLPREDRQEVVMSLRDAGLSIRAIAVVTGDSPRTVRREIAGGASAPPDATDERDNDVLIEAPRKVTGTDGKTYWQQPQRRARTAPEEAIDIPSNVPQWRGKPITPDLRDQIFGRGITANKRADHFVSSVARAATLLVESGFTPEEMRAAARPGDIERWVIDLRNAASDINRFLRQLEK